MKKEVDDSSTIGATGRCGEREGTDGGQEVSWHTGYTTQELLSVLSWPVESHILEENVNCSQDQQFCNLLLLGVGIFVILFFFTSQHHQCSVNPQSRSSSILWTMHPKVSLRNPLGALCSCGVQGWCPWKRPQNSLSLLGKIPWVSCQWTLFPSLDFHQLFPCGLYYTKHFIKLDIFSLPLFWLYFVFTDLEI